MYSNRLLQVQVDNLRNIILDKIAVDFVGKVSDFEVSTGYDVEADAIMYRVRLFLMQYSVLSKDTKTMSIPSTWIDHFKEKYFPSWLKKIFPVKYKTIVIKTDITTNYICPHLPIPKEGIGTRHIEKIVSKAEELHKHGIGDA
jgi:hypothetical protein